MIGEVDGIKALQENREREMKKDGVEISNTLYSLGLNRSMDSYAE